MASRRQVGFTLIELLVALFITAVIFAMGYGAINQALSDRESLKARQDRLTAVHKAIGILTRDFTQLTPRPVRQPIGDGWLPCLRAEGDANPLVEFTRGGWANPAGIQRPALQRVAYVFEDGTLRRQHWTVLDATMASPVVQRELLDDVEAVSFRFMDESRRWGTVWPIAQPGGDPELIARWRPIAVEVTLELKDWGRLVRVIEVAG